jgi:hypothetical protein
MREDTSHSRRILPMFCTARLTLAKRLSVIVNSIVVLPKLVLPEPPVRHFLGQPKSINAGIRKSFFLPEIN